MTTPRDRTRSPSAPIRARRSGLWIAWTLGACGGTPEALQPPADGARAGAASFPARARPSPAPVAPDPPTPPRADGPRRSPALAAAIAALPAFDRIDADTPTRFVLRGALTPRRARALGAEARAVVADVTRRFVGAGAAERHPVDVCLFEDDASYTAFVDGAVGGSHSMLGFYLARERLVVANLGRSVGNLRHELVHPLIGDHFPGVPAWLNEGLGSLYGTARRSGGRLEFLVNYRLRDVRAAIDRGQLPTLDDIARSSSAELYGERSATYYGLARYLLLYLDARGALEAFYRELRAEPVTFEHQRRLLAAHVDYDGLVAWTRRLRVGRPAARPRNRR